MRDAKGKPWINGLLLFTRPRPKETRLLLFVLLRTGYATKQTALKQAPRLHASQQGHHSAPCAPCHNAAQPTPRVLPEDGPHLCRPCAVGPLGRPPPPFVWKGNRRHTPTANCAACWHRCACLENLPRGEMHLHEPRLEEQVGDNWSPPSVINSCKMRPWRNIKNEKTFVDNEVRDAVPHLRESYVRKPSPLASLVTA